MCKRLTIGCDTGSMCVPEALHINVIIYDINDPKDKRMIHNEYMDIIIKQFEAQLCATVIIKLYFFNMLYLLTLIL